MSEQNQHPEDASFSHDDQEIAELLAGEVLGDLSDDERQRLELLRSEEHTELAFSLAHAAASVQLACGDIESEAIPTDLLSRLRSSAAIHVPPSVSDTQIRTSPPQSPQASSVQPASHASWSVREMVAWTSCAAALLLCVLLVRNGKVGTGTSDPAADRQTLLEDAPDQILQVAWAPGTTPFEPPVEGDVVWDNNSQTGYMRFVGLPINDAAIQQYQLWIIDPARDEEPIDGGVFDITQAGEVIVPIHAKLAVIDPKAFAITIEQPGGVVVSTQERLPLLAAVQ